MTAPAPRASVQRSPLMRKDALVLVSAVAALVANLVVVSRSGAG